MTATRSRDRLMPATLPLGRIRGVPLGLHYSWFIIAGLITLSLSGHFRSTHPDWSLALIWAVSICTAGLFFVSLLAHELSHAIVITWLDPQPAARFGSGSLFVREPKAVRFSGTQNELRSHRCVTRPSCC